MNGKYTLKSFIKVFMSYVLHLYPFGNMEFEKTTIEGLFIIKPRIFSDERGYFYESYNQAIFEKWLGYRFYSRQSIFIYKGVLRGLHFQAPPFLKVS